MAKSASSVSGARLDPDQLAAACVSAKAALSDEDDPRVAVEMALRALHSELEEALVSVFVLEHGRLWLAAQRGYTMIPDGLSIEDGIMGRAVRTRRAQLAHDVRSDPDYVPAAHGVVSHLSVPLQRDGVVFALFTLESRVELPRESTRLVRNLMRRLLPLTELVRAAPRFDLSALARLFVYVSSLREPAAIADVAASSLARVLPVETSQVALFNEAGSIEQAAAWRSGENGLNLLSTDELESLRSGVETTAVVDVVDATGAGSEDQPRSVVWLPLRASATELGVLVGSMVTTDELDRSQAEVASLLAAHVAASLDAALSLGRERQNAATDSLTGLLNRRGFEERLDLQLGESQDQRRPLSVLVLDCDDFKAVNDRAGHEFGDALLREAGQALDSLLPPTAWCARLGGDEFVVLLPDSDAEATQALGDRLRVRLAGRLADAGFPLHVSAGFATYPFDGAGASALLRGADQALYVAKERGKDRVLGFRNALGDPTPTEGAESRGRERRRAPLAPEGTSLNDMAEAADAIWEGRCTQDVLERLCKALTFVVGATGCLASRVDGRYLWDAARHSLRDIDFGEEAGYLIADFPLTERVLSSGQSCSVSFLDPDIDRAEAFVLRDLDMNCVLLLPLLVRARPWGLVELYDVRLRHFSHADQGVAEFLVRQAVRRVETLTSDNVNRTHRLPVIRVPESDGH